MPAYLPRSWNKQPARLAGLDYRNPLTRNLRAIWDMRSRGQIEFLGKAPGTPNVSTSIVTEAGEVGVGNSSINFPDANYFNFSSGASYTFLFRIRAIQESPSVFFEINRTNPSFGDWFFIGLGQDLTGNLTDELILVYKRFSNFGINAVAFTANGTATRNALLYDGRWHTVMVTCNGSAWAIYLDGISRAITLRTGSTNNGVIALSGVDQVRLNVNANNSCSLAAVWSVDMAAHAVELHQRPWQLFRPAANQTFYSLPSQSAGSDVSVSVTGVAGTGEVGSVTATGTASTSVTGVTATGAVGTATATGTANTLVTGVVGTGAVGTAAAAGSANVSVTGVSGTGAIGSVATPGNESVSVTGVAGTGAVGTVTATGAISVSVTGVAGTGAVGSATVTTTSSVSVAVTGVSGTGAIGNEAVTGTASVPVTGVQATGQVGAVVVPQNASTTLTGVAATGAVGSVTATAGADISVSVTGTQAIASVGSVAIGIGATVFPIGVVCVAHVTPVLVWGPVDDSQTPNWVVVNDSNTVTWTQVIT